MSPRLYSAFLADPPWAYRDSADAGERGAAHKYATMSLANICALPVPRIAADDCALFLWATPPMLREAFAVMDAWGFGYRTIAFTWVKTAGDRWVSKERRPYLDVNLAWGMGNWTRANAEHVLLGIRGRPKRVSAAVHSVVIAPRGRHSEKPREVGRRIVELLGDVPRVELFARERSAGWSAWGDEVPGGSDDVFAGAA